VEDEDEEDGWLLPVLLLLLLLLLVAGYTAHTSALSKLSVHMQLVSDPSVSTVSVLLPLPHPTCTIDCALP
jgi:hypothetical protein